MSGRSSAYGRELGDRFRLDDAPAFVNETLKRSEIAVTKIQCRLPNQGLTDPLPAEDGYLVALQYEACLDHEVWLDGRAIQSEPFEAGVSTFYDLKRDPRAVLRSTSHCYMYYLPREALDIVADTAGVPRIGELTAPAGVGVHDPIMLGLTTALMPAFTAPEQASRLFIENVTMAVGTHIAQVYGGMKEPTRGARGELAPWQVRRAKEIIDAHLSGDIPLVWLAQECGLSPGHFARGFRQSTGVTPHRWLLVRRCETASLLLRDRKLGLVEVALACGFSDQSHFTRVFSGLMGMSPGAYRRQVLHS